MAALTKVATAEKGRLRASAADGQLQSSRRSAQFRRKRSKQAGQREIDPHAPPAPDFIFDQRIAW